MKTFLLREISETEFYSDDPIFQVVVHDYPRKFASLQLQDASHALKLCWCSDLVKPVVVTDLPSSEVWIGVDERLVSLSLCGRILFSIGLSSPLLQVKICKSYIVVICEIQVLIVNRDHSLRSIVDFVDIADDADVKGNELVVTFVGGGEKRFAI